MPGQQSAAGRRASGRDMIVGQAGRFGGECVDVWRLDDGIAVTRQVAVSLVIGDDEHDVWFVAGKNARRQEADE